MLKRLGLALITATLLFPAAANAAFCTLTQTQPGTAQENPTGLTALPHNRFYLLVVLGPTKQFVNEGVRNPGEEVPLPFNVRFGAGTYEGQVWEAHTLNKAKEQPPAVVKDKLLSSCTAPLT